MIGAELVESDAIDDNTASGDCEPTVHRLAITTGRIVWDENNKLTNRRIFITVAPPFPIDELIGEIIEPY